MGNVDDWNEDTQRLHEILAEKTWIGFDLDDTLHEFRRSSGKAAQAVLAQISQRYGHSLPTLQSEYSKVLKAKTAAAFSDRKTSFDYRRERFCAVLVQCSLPQEDQFVSDLLDLYETTLMESLELKHGARELLEMIKAMGKKVVIITEGPQDAQERTIEALGISQYVDFLATTNYFGVAKINGLFPKVLRHLGVSPGDIAYIGDSEERDIKPAMAEGIFAFHLADTEPLSLDSSPPRLDTLTRLHGLLVGNKVS